MIKISIYQEIQKALGQLHPKMMRDHFTIWTSIFLFMLTSAAQAQEPPTTPYLLQQVATLQSAPESILALIETDTGSVMQLPGASVELPTSIQSIVQKKQRLLGAIAPKEIIRDGKPIQFSFFALAADATVSATPVKRWSAADIRINSKTIDELARETASTNEEIHQLELDKNELETRLAALKNEAAKIAGINDIVTLKIRHSDLKVAHSNLNRGIDILRASIDKARSNSAPDDSDVRRQDLSLSLRETAQRTAIARRLVARKQESASADFQRKLELIKQYEAVDAEELAQEVLALRQERKRLQEKLRGSKRSAAVDDF